MVVNHHLFFADVMLRDEGMAELLPACNAVIFDEAHQLPETATLFFGENVRPGQLLDLAATRWSRRSPRAGDVPALRPAVAPWRRPAAMCASRCRWTPRALPMPQATAKPAFDRRSSSWTTS